MVKKMVSMLLVTASLATLAACNSKEPAESSEIIVESTTTSATVSEEAVPASSESSEETSASSSQAPDGLFDPSIDFAVNPLTGIQDMDKANEGKRSVGIVVSNVQAAIPQRGVSTPDVIYEYITEGGVTRLLCVYSDFHVL